MKIFRYTFTWIVLIYGVLILNSPGYAQLRDKEITAADLKQDVSYLASDALEGRYPGTEGDSLAANYIRDHLRFAGAEMLFDDGFQYFKVVTAISAGENNSLTVNKKKLVAGEDFMPLSYSESTGLDAEAVFAGFGFDIDEDSLDWDDYEGLDVKGKWVIILRGDPDISKRESPFVPYSSDRDKVLTARDKEVGGVLLVSGEEYDGKDELAALHFDKTMSNAGIPVIHIKRAVANQLLEASFIKIEQLEDSLKASGKPNSFNTGSVVSGRAEVLLEEVTTMNVAGVIRSDDPLLAEEYIVVGAHYDHLGMGGPSSGSRLADTSAVHNGADDNASGVAGVIELAYKLGSQRDRLGRSIILLAFGAEEMGVLGSRYFVEHSPLPLTSIKAMVNMDMIGRMDTEKRSVMVGGTGTSAEAEAILDSLPSENLSFAYSPEGYGPSDHAAFYGEDIPVFFFSTGAHTDYHTPDDDVDKLHFEEQGELLDYIYGLLVHLSAMDEPLSFREAGPKQQTGGGGKRFKVTLGIMPDFTSSQEEGLGVGGVTPGGPAYKGGMEKGDVIIALEGKEIRNIYDYMGRLKKLEKGQIITADILRDGEKKILIIQL